MRKNWYMIQCGGQARATGRPREGRSDAISDEAHAAWCFGWDAVDKVIDAELNKLRYEDPDHPAPGGGAADQTPPALGEPVEDRGGGVPTSPPAAETPGRPGALGPPVGTQTVNELRTFFGQGPYPETGSP